jgi:hypothetical protein
MAYKIDPDVLRKVAKQVVGTPLEDRELITRAIEMLADEYPDLIDAAPGDWVGSKAGGILGKVRFLYFSPREYIVIFGSPTGFVPRTRVCPQIYRRVRQVDPETDSPVTHRYRLRRPHPGVPGVRRKTLSTPQGGHGSCWPPRGGPSCAATTPTST